MFIISETLTPVLYINLNIAGSLTPSPLLTSIPSKNNFNSCGVATFKREVQHF